MSSRFIRTSHRLALRSARLLVLAALIVLCAGAGAGAAVAAGGDNSAVAVNTKDGSSVFKLAFAIDQVASSSVTNQNAAVAYASCNSCQTVAISIQILLISGSPTTFTPTNVAVAVNQNCTLCDTLAVAYQFTVGYNTQLKFTNIGRQQIADIRQQLQALGNSGLTGSQIDAKVNALMTQLGSVLQTQLVPVNGPASAQNPRGSPPSATTSTGTTSTPTTTSTTPTSTAPTTTSVPTTTTTTTTPTSTSTTTSPTTTTTTAPTTTTPTATTGPSTTTTP